MKKKHAILLNLNAKNVGNKTEKISICSYLKKTEMV